MEEVKPGWMTTEFWMTASKQVISLGVLVGIFTTKQGDGVADALAKLAAAAMVVWAQAWVVVSYLKARTDVKIIASPEPPMAEPVSDFPKLGVIWVVGLGLALWGLSPSQAHAQFGLINIQRHNAPAAPAPAPAPVYPQPAGTDPALIAVLQQLSAQNAQLVAQHAQMLGLMSRQPQPSPPVVIPYPQPQPAQPLPQIHIGWPQPIPTPPNVMPIPTPPLVVPIPTPPNVVPIPTPPIVVPIPTPPAPTPIPTPPGGLMPIPTPRPVADTMQPQRYTRTVKALYPTR